ncbi:MAG: hypothetical protein HY664_03510 [Chloroflexi bacterium]|nr:hypothetical protein [Chloroflexota bacterium]
MEEKFLMKLVSAVKCTVCGEPYAETGIRVLGHKGDLWFLSVSCSGCSSQGLVAAIIDKDHATEVVTDLTEAEQAVFSEFGPVTADDVLDMHQFLEDFSGDFSGLLAKG